MRIAIVAPGRRLDEETASRLIGFAGGREPAAELIIHPQCFLSDGHFAGPDAARLAAFMACANDPGIDAIWFARGGYGAVRIAAQAVARLSSAAAAKTYLGYSDMGFLLGALMARGIGRPAHGPMPADLARAGGEAAIARALAFLTRGDPAALEPHMEPQGAAAFNLTVLAHMAGTSLMPDLSGHVLMVEEVSEPLYRIDRCFAQLAGQDWFARLKGLRLGRVSDVIPNDVDFGQTPDEIARHWCAKAGVPFLGAADIGHDAGNRVVVF